MEFLKVYKDGDSLMIVIKNTDQNAALLSRLTEELFKQEVVIEEVGFVDDKPPETKPILPLTPEEFKRLRTFKKDGGQMTPDEQEAYDSFVRMLHQEHTPEEKIKLLAAISNGKRSLEFIEKNYEHLWGTMFKYL